jgi:transposase
MNGEHEMILAACIGLDWGDERHSIHLQAVGASEVEAMELEQKPDALHAWVAQLRMKFQGQKIAIAIEQSKGAVIHALMMYDFLVLYPVNPKALARYREAFSTSGAKDDPTDAKLLLDLVLLHRERLRPWVPDSAQTRTIQLLVEQRRKLIGDRTRLINRITSLVKMYFPQALDWVGDISSVQACDFLTAWPTLEAVRGAKKAQLRRFYQSHNCRNEKVIQERITAIAHAHPLTEDPAVLQTLSFAVQAAATQLRSIIESVARFDRLIADVFTQHPDHELFDSLPGAGPVCAPRLLAAMGSDRSRWDSASQVQCFSGIAPVTERSGKSCWVHRRLACPKFVRQSFHEYAAISIRYSDWAGAYYDQQRARGQKHHAAVRTLAYKWIRIIYRCWADRKPYDEQIYIAALRRHASSLVSEIPLNA